MLVIEIDAVGSKALERGVDNFLDLLRLAVETTGFEVETEFACDDDLVAERRKRFSDKVFARKWTVNFGGIKKRDASFMGCTNDLNALVPVCGRSVVGADAHAPSADFRDFQLSEFSCFHFVFLTLIR